MSEMTYYVNAQFVLISIHVYKMCSCITYIEVSSYFIRNLSMMKWNLEEYTRKLATLFLSGQRAMEMEYKIRNYKNNLLAKLIQWLNCCSSHKYSLIFKFEFLGITCKLELLDCINSTFFQTTDRAERCERPLCSVYIYFMSSNLSSSI